MVENVRISKAALKDLDSVLKLQTLAFLSEAEKNKDEIISSTQSPDSLKREFENYLFLKAEYGTDLVGCVKAREKGEFCWIENIVVAPQFQKRGIGSSLMIEIEKAFPHTRLYLLCSGTTTPENIDFFRTLGYQKRELSKDGKKHSLFVKHVKQIVK